MNLDLKAIPFSAARSYMAVSQLPENYRTSVNREGLYLRTIRGGAKSTVIGRLTPIKAAGQEELAYTYRASESEIVIETAEGALRLCFADELTILVCGEKGGPNLRLDFVPALPYFDFLHEVPCEEKMRYQVNCFGQNVKYLMWSQDGTAEMYQKWDGCVAKDNQMTFSGDSDGVLAVIREIHSEWDGIAESYDYEVCRKQMKAKYEAFFEAMPEVPKRYYDTARAAAYVDWICIVAGEGFLTRDAMLMSKNWMCSTWTWDHCFNAVVLAYANPAEAWNQWILPFDLQDPSGRIPDRVNNFEIDWSYCKPPVHGWALSRMMKVMDLSPVQLAEAYDKLSKWTWWWLNYRDYDRDGLCEYTHGYDSGWDNATAFREAPVAAVPDLQTYLILQMETLADLANRLGRKKEAAEWEQRSSEMLTVFLKYCFVDGQPRILVSGSHKVVESQSLIQYIPVMLAHRLPDEIRKNLVDVLKTDKFLTKYGFATESPASLAYEPDGYWLGPIWAPSTLLILDGLQACGEDVFAAQTAEVFCKMVQEHGFAENFNAVTGEGLRDLAYTWTPSVFLTLAHDYTLESV